MAKNEPPKIDIQTPEDAQGAVNAAQDRLSELQNQLHAEKSNYYHSIAHGAEGWKPLTTASYNMKERTRSLRSHPQANDVINMFGELKDAVKQNGGRTYQLPQDESGNRMSISKIRKHPHFSAGLTDHLNQIVENLFEDPEFKSFYGNDVGYEIHPDNDGNPILAIKPKENGRFHSQVASGEPLAIYDPHQGKVMVGPHFDKENVHWLQLAALMQMGGIDYAHHITNMVDPKHMPDSIKGSMVPDINIPPPEVPSIEKPHIPLDYKIPEEEIPDVMNYLFGDGHDKIAQSLMDIGVEGNSIESTKRKMAVWHSFTNKHNMRSMRASLGARYAPLTGYDDNGSVALYPHDGKLRYEVKSDGKVHRIDIDKDYNMVFPGGLTSALRAAKTGDLRKHTMNLGNMLRATQYKGLQKIINSIAISDLTDEVNEENGENTGE